jgi:RimJ/RimL family protein N-acetyltransferase
MIRKYREDDFPLLESWVTDADLLFQFAGPGWSFPLTMEQIKKHQSEFPFKQLYIGYENQAAYGIGEIITNEPHSPRIGRLLIGDPAQRGKGLGESLLKELIAECIRLYDPVSICLFVLDSNYEAIRCYEKAGFTKSDEEIPDLLFNQFPARIIKMVLDPKTLQ